jgi:hypothetical protein
MEAGFVPSYSRESASRGNHLARLPRWRPRVDLCASPYNRRVDERVMTFIDPFGFQVIIQQLDLFSVAVNPAGYEPDTGLWKVMDCWLKALFYWLSVVSTLLVTFLFIL